MCTAQYAACSNAARLREVLARLHRIMGGSSDTELKLLAVPPTRQPSAPTAVTMVTPVANAPRALRNSRLSNSPFSSIGRILPAVPGRAHYLSAGDPGVGAYKMLP